MGYPASQGLGLRGFTAHGTMAYVFNTHAAWMEVCVFGVQGSSTRVVFCAQAAGEHNLTLDTPVASSVDFFYSLALCTFLLTDNTKLRCILTFHQSTQIGDSFPPKKLFNTQKISM